MNLGRSIIINGLFSTALIVLTITHPVSVLAEGTDTTSPAPSASTTSTPTSTTQQVAPKTGPKKPAGADANSYHYNESTGKWENDHYIWDPVTQQTMPKDSQSYSYNPSTKMWDTTKWQYDAPSGTYIPNTVSTNQTPEGQQAPAPSPKPKSSTNGTFDLYYNANISNTVNQTAKTGDALVTSNTTAGSAASGAAESIATILNLLQSSASFNGGASPTTFVSTIQGDVVGDILINPALISQLKSSQNALPSTNNLQVKAQNDGLINNKITLSSTSGNAGVDKNTTAGSAQTGSAYAMANVVNVLNSAIGAGQSFVGTVNIYGNLNGDILLPPDILKGLSAVNSTPSSSNLSAVSSNTSATIKNDQNISNNISTNTASGTANVSNNTTAGSAKTGKATSNITLLNLTGKNIIGKDAILVFVNVLGKWTGLIMNAPAGSTTATIAANGNNIDKPSPTNQNTDVQLTNNSQINNDIYLTAKSGDASVTNNTKAGDAKTGDALASVNLLNIINSDISLSDWFGILFINVFGSWNGSFGVNTSAGSAPVAAVSNTNSGSNQSNNNVFNFVAHPATTQRTYTDGAGYIYNARYDGESETTQASNEAQVLAATAPTTNGGNQNGNPIGIIGEGHSLLRQWPFMIGLLLSALILGSERYLALRSKQEEATVTIPFIGD